MPHVYVTGHKNPDTDSIASAIGYAEYKNLVDPENFYAPARLGEVNAQTGWALKRSGAKSPRLLRHIMLRVKDVMHEDLVLANRNDPLRSVGLVMAKNYIGQVPIVDDEGSLAGIVTERDLARMYIRESRGASTFAETPVSVAAMVGVLEGELLVGGDDDSPLPAGLLRDEPHDPALGPLLGGHEREPPDRGPRGPHHRDNPERDGGPLPGCHRRGRRQGTHRGRIAHRPSQPAAPARSLGGPRRGWAERQGGGEGGDSRDPGPPPYRRHRDEHPHPRDLRPRGLDGHPHRRALQGCRPGARGVHGGDAAG